MKKNKIINIGIILLIGIFLTCLISAQISYCCEKTTYGAWCQNEEESKCDANFQKAQTSCAASSFCRQGCCFNSQEGTCLENTPQKVCNDKGGVWDASENCDISQCQLGCCLIGNQAAFVTQTRCKRLSNLYGLEINFRTDAENEASCILSATSDIEGACVFEQEFEVTCKRTTQKECNEIKAQGKDSTIDFYVGKLCSDENLGTNCAPSSITTCVEGKDAVYYTDTCGNLANIYDSSKYNDKNYWAEIKTIPESCGYNSANGNANSRICGNCDYFSGSTCKKYERGVDAGAPNYGNYICRDLGCTFEGQKYAHGESWCAIVSNGKLILGENENFNQKTDLSKENQPGSRYFRLLCYNSEVLVEPCADFRSEICIQSSIEDYRVGACRVNRWQDCLEQETKLDCENSDKRDCIWFKYSDFVEGCAPKYAPGFEFWKEGQEEICDKGNVQCTMKYEEGLLWESIDEGDCEENCECSTLDWGKQINNVCGYLGDCGSKKNYLGYKGFYNITEDLHIIPGIEKV
ncbi:MAG TPA: hypothetical protein VJ438_06530 [Candidatus Nanoarchaeia archaeon]|nr:hypothetical protein [Candidatus Nanoarchaeia archaeon]